MNQEWSHIRDTVLMIELSAGQIEAAMTDSNASVEVLTQSFTGIADTMSQISASVAALPDSGQSGELKTGLKDATEHVTGMIHQAIMAFQFYDKLVQRLGHVTLSLEGLSSLVTDPSRITTPEEWTALQTSIRAKYSMKEEQVMFDAVMNGMSVKEALAHFMEEMKQKQSYSDDDIELF